ncbi:MAG: hypothetical protein C4534_02025 [Gaiellales bacterium]|nr:MAG: hypothetical protein C4534_02025 [Gaiellales bacterium]
MAEPHRVWRDLNEAIELVDPKRVRPILIVNGRAIRANRWEINATQTCSPYGQPDRFDRPTNTLPVGEHFITSPWHYQVRWLAYNHDEHRVKTDRLTMEVRPSGRLIYWVGSRSRLDG